MRCMLAVARDATLILMALGLVGIISFEYWRPKGAVFVFRNVEVVTPVVDPGGTLKLVYESDHLRACPTVITRWIVTPDGLRMHSFPDVVGGYSPLKEGNITPVEIKVPDFLPAGQYLYRARLISECADDSIHVAEPPDASFAIASEGLRLD